MTEQRVQGDMEIIVDEDFSFEGFQVVRGEFFAHTYEPSITFADCKVYVNTACIRKLPERSYIQILVNPEKRKLAVRPCNEYEKDSFRWCSATEKRSPRQITCKIFFAKVFTLMGWDPKDRYKMLGKLIQTGEEILFVFDLQSPEVYERKISDDGKLVKKRTPSYPENWKNQFGIPVSEHNGGLLVNIFKESVVFGLEKDSGKTPEELETKEQSMEGEADGQVRKEPVEQPAAANDRPEKETDSDLQENPGGVG